MALANTLALQPPSTPTQLDRLPPVRLDERHHCSAGDSMLAFGGLKTWPDGTDLQLMARAGIVASMQANFAYPDDTVVHTSSALLGAARAARAQP